VIHFQYQQFLILLILLIIGKSTAYIYLSWIDIVTILSVIVLIEHFFIYFKSRTLIYISFSALSSSLGVILMLSSPHLWIYMFVIMLGLLQKHFIRIAGKHLFNPSNFALMMGLLFFYDEAHIVLGQLGDERWLQVLALILAFSILIRVQRWVISMVFIVSYVGIQYAIIVSSDPMIIIEDIFLRFSSISFLLFLLFMLTDPKTTPHTPLKQIFFALFIAFFSSVLDYFYGFRVQHLFLSLFFFSFVCMYVEILERKVYTKIEILKLFLLLILVLSAIIYIELQPPYYLEMNG